MGHIYCNPLEISYKYQHPLHGKYAYKEAADPTLIRFKGLYYLFVSKCGGFYYSEDLFNWKFHEDRNLEIHGYAPDVNEYNGALYFCASAYMNKCRILRSEDPFKGFEEVSKPFTFWDPHLYFEDDKAYLYWGCSSTDPIYGIEMDPETMMPRGEKFTVYSANDKDHGVDNKKIYDISKRSLWDKYISLFTGNGTFVEGAFLNKINDTYYFQYATPGTEFPTYSDAVLISESPEGPFKWQSHNPYSIVPSGFVTGSGHGSTFFDEYDNLWHISTCCVGVNHNFERRVGMWPAGIDKDGILFCNQYFADYPKEIPDGKFDAISIKPKYMLLSYKKKVYASSEKEECKKENVSDESIKTMWSSLSNKEGEYLVIDLGKEYSVGAVQVNFGDYKTKKKRAPLKEYGGTISQERYIEEEEVTYCYRLEYSEDDKVYYPYGEETINTTLPHKLISLETKARYIKIVFISAPYNQDFTLSGLRVFGLDDQEKPKRIESKAIRTSNTEALIRYKRSGEENGVVIRLGCEKDKLYNSVLLYEGDEYKITFLNTEANHYYYALDTFNESGITEGDVKEIEDVRSN